MIIASEWAQNQQNLITFILRDATGAELTGLTDGVDYDMEISKAGGVLAAAAGTFNEIGRGWYSYLSTAAEADTRGPVSIAIFGAGIVQQNLEYVVSGRNINAVVYDTYQVTHSVSGLPIEGALVWFTIPGFNSRIVWSGYTDAFGFPKDTNGNDPILDPGTYNVWKQLAGFVDDQGPDSEVVS